MTDLPLRRTVTIVNRRGLHARPAAKLVACLAPFEAQLTVIKDGTSVPGRSIMGLLMLGAAQGSSLEITASGPDAREALDTYAALIDAGFGETDT